jgi:hypothetical protein
MFTRLRDHPMRAFHPLRYAIELNVFICLAAATFLIWQGVLGARSRPKPALE